MLRDRLLARLAEMGTAPDHQRLAAEVLGIKGAPPELARKLVAQALVLGDRREEWRRAGERICREAPATPAVYLLKDAADRPLYVGKAINLRRRLRAHFGERRARSPPSGAVPPTPSGARSAPSSRHCYAKPSGFTSGSRSSTSRSRHRIRRARNPARARARRPRRRRRSRRFGELVGRADGE